MQDKTLVSHVNFQSLKESHLISYFVKVINTVYSRNLYHLNKINVHNSIIAHSYNVRYTKQ